jgi:anthranilate phosphoribosyltransferase
MICEAINQLLEGQSLSAEQAEGVMTEVMAGEATPAQIAGFLIALRVKGETVEEITGCAKAMRQAAIKVTPHQASLVDTCGTGGDRSGTFNISTTAAFVAAGAGLPIAKHGNRSVSSLSGSADVLAALGVNLDLTPEQVAQCIDEVGIGFLFAPKLHPAMKYAVGPRRELGVRTIFNILGPLTNPAGAQAQVLGVYDPVLTEVLASVLQGLGSRAAYVVHGDGGLDELTTTGPNRISVFGVAPGNGAVVTQRLDPATNAAITRAILAGEDRGAKRDVTLLNAAAALHVGGLATDLADGVVKATESLDNGAALSTLEELIKISQKSTA